MISAAESSCSAKLNNAVDIVGDEGSPRHRPQSLTGVQLINLFVSLSLSESGYVRLKFGGRPLYVVLK
jgi:hypothetical protein